MKQVIRCRVNGEVETIDLPDIRQWEWYSEQIDVRIVQHVRGVNLKHPYAFLCDEEGLLKKHPTVNFIGSYFYGTQDHGEPIVGDILIVKDIQTAEGYDFGGLEPGEADIMANWMVENFWPWHDAVMAKIGDRLTGAPKGE